MQKNSASLSKYIVDSSLSNEHHLALGRVQQQLVFSSATVDQLYSSCRYLRLIKIRKFMYIIILAAFRTDRQKKCNYSIKSEEFTWKILNQRRFLLDLPPSQKK
jgi:hypothetical protein